MWKGECKMSNDGNGACGAKRKLHHVTFRGAALLSLRASAGAVY